ncbi:hypothetical protein Tco_0744324 [Tanacetum coccineum]
MFGSHTREVETGVQWISTCGIAVSVERSVTQTEGRVDFSLNSESSRGGRWVERSLIFGGGGLLLRIEEERGVQWGADRDTGGTHMDDLVIVWLLFSLEVLWIDRHGMTESERSKVTGSEFESRLRTLCVLDRTLCGNEVDLSSEAQCGTAGTHTVLYTSSLISNQSERVWERCLHNSQNTIESVMARVVTLNRRGGQVIVKDLRRHDEAWGEREGARSPRTGHLVDSSERGRLRSVTFLDVTTLVMDQRDGSSEWRVWVEGRDMIEVMEDGDWGRWRKTHSILILRSRVVRY